AFGAGDGDAVSVLEHGSCVAATDHRRNAEFAGDDGSVTGAAAAVGHNRGGALHDRFPVGIGHVGDQNIAELYPVHFSRVAHDAYRAAADLLSNGSALSKHLAMLL